MSFSKTLTKRSVHFILVAFWTFTWHSYAVGAIYKEAPQTGASPTMLLQKGDISDGHLRDSKNRLQFKRRPFITKADTLHIEPFSSSEPLSLFEHVVPFKERPALDIVHSNPLLRSPPKLA